MAPIINRCIALHNTVDTGVNPRGAGGWTEFLNPTAGGWIAHGSRWIEPAARLGFQYQMIRAAGGVDGGASTIKLDDMLRAEEEGNTQLGRTAFSSTMASITQQYNLWWIGHVGGDLDRMIAQYGSTVAYARAATILNVYKSGGCQALSFDTAGVRATSDPLWDWIKTVVIPMGFQIFCEPPPANQTPLDSMHYGIYTISSVWQNYINPADPLGYDSDHLFSKLTGPAIVQVPDGNESSIILAAQQVASLNNQQAAALLPIYWVVSQQKRYSDIVALSPAASFQVTLQDGAGNKYAWKWGH